MRTHSIRRMSDETVRECDDCLAVEEPLEIRAAGDPVAVTMRTPGHDAELAVGFLFSEGIVKSAGDIGRAGHCGQPGSEGYGNTVDVVPAPGVAFDIHRVLATRRGTLTTAACGVCGRRSIDDLLENCRPLADGPVVPADRIFDAVRSLQDAQEAFVRTGGLHGVAALDSAGQLMAAREDVGRHNAVDKVVGSLLMSGRLGAKGGATLLAVSGRASFEIIQKAAVARIPIVVAVSAASTLAADLAERLNITLAGFVRENRGNLYTDRAGRVGNAPKD